MAHDAQQLRTNLITTINQLSLDKLQLLADYVTHLTADAPAPDDDPIWELGQNPGHIDDGITDGARNHDKYLYMR